MNDRSCMLRATSRMVTYTVESSKGRQTVGAKFVRKECDPVIHNVLHVNIIETRDCSKLDVAWSFALAKRVKIHFGIFPQSSHCQAFFFRPQRI